jgi:hypothetical protein
MGVKSTDKWVKIEKVRLQKLLQLLTAVFLDIKYNWERTTINNKISGEQIVHTAVRNLSLPAKELVYEDW